MSRTEECVQLGPTILSTPDKKSAKVKAYWGKTIPIVAETPRVPAWHRLGWNSKYAHRTASSSRPAAAGTCITEHQDRVQHPLNTTYARHHTHTHSHSQTQQSAHRLVLQQSWVPGMNGAPALQENHNAWCSELDGELMHIHQTLDRIQKRSVQRSQQNQTADVNDTMSMRAKLNESVANQIEFFTAIQSAWCNMEPKPVAAVP